MPHRSENQEHASRRQVWRYAALLAVIWTLLAGISLVWNIERQHEVSLQLALNTARDAFKKDQAYRQWASEHGGVYVEPTEKTPPSPWMAHLPDRDLVTTDGRKLTLMNPAYMLREMMQDFGHLYGIKGRIVGIVYLNPNNKADPWEAEAINRFSTGQAQEVVEVSAIDGEQYMRLVRPMIMQESCQKCHGHLGFPNGSVRGAVSVSVPMAPYAAAETAAHGAIAATHSGVWLVGLLGIGWGGRRAAGRLGERARSAAEARLAAQMFGNALEAMVITNADGTILRVNPAFTQLTGYDASEAVGHKANLLRSYHHDDGFYAAMWQELNEHGRWQGEIMNRRKDGSIFAAWETIAAVAEPDAKQPRHYVASFRDITEQLEAQKHIQHLAHFDPLTDLPNRALFHDRLTHALAFAARDDRKLAVLFVDLDGFKKVNDTLGHRAGDELLVEVARRLRSSVRGADTVSRLGGDEFALILERVADSEDAVMVAEKLLNALQAPIVLNGRDIFVGASIGIGFYPDDGEDAASLLQHADTAMYQAKAEGKGRFRFYSSDMTQRQERRLELEAGLRTAIADRVFQVYYQPKQSLKHGSVAGFEALVRWPHPELGLISPADFVPLAEELGLITQIDMLVLEQACAMGKACLEAGHRVTMAVNLSSLDLKSLELVESIRSVIDASGFPAELIVLEITESFAMELGSGGIEALERLAALGVSLAIDDFGTGYSSLSYLKQLPVGSVKIDRSFVRDIGTDSRDTMLVQTIVGLAHSLDLSVVAEGVEMTSQRSILRDQECDEAQGYLIARPMPCGDVLAFLGEYAAAPSRSN
ncbi:PAS:GGDEF [Magnetospirillum sp. LM-5]|nr:PAS:GGDEF [Magnetospirillum sp. LM-5]